MNFSEMKIRLAKLDTACVTDVNKKLRVLDPQIRPVRTGLILIGMAHTVRCKDDFLTVIKGLRDSVQDEVLVIDTCGSRVAVAGELFSLEASRRGLALLAEFVGGSDNLAKGSINPVIRCCLGV